MRSIFLFLICFLAISFVSAQEKNESLSILKSPENWRSELIPFPLSFAPEIDFTGVEDIRFAKGWNDQESPEFWAYAFVWYLENDPQLSDSRLQELMKLYYYGIMGVDNTVALFLPSGDGHFIGRVQTHDRFFTKQPLLLNIRVETSYCTKQKRHLVLFQLSPQAFDHAVWESFQEVEIAVDCGE
ncbi:MAG: hypothetical protein AAF206_21730 [Bacteroidota bacterium]